VVKIKESQSMKQSSEMNSNKFVLETMDVEGYSLKIYQTAQTLELGGPLDLSTQGRADV
jgi:hypothetical protein